MSTDKKQSILSKILDGAIDAVKRPFVVKRIKRAFSSAADSLEETLLGLEAQQTTARESLVAAAKVEGNLSSYIQKLVDLQSQVEDTKKAQLALTQEKADFLD